MAQTPQQNFNAMRQDAIRRSKEMQRRAVSVPSPPPELPAPPESVDFKHFLNGLDSEKLVLLGLLYLLYKDGAEIELLVAVAYILL